MRPAEGREALFVTRVCRSTAAHPATRGVDMPILESNIQSASVEVPYIVSTGALRDFAERIEVPGATTLGLKCRSTVGPRLLKAPIPSGRLAMRSSRIGAAENLLGR